VVKIVVVSDFIPMDLITSIPAKLSHPQKLSGMPPLSHIRYERYTNKMDVRGRSASEQAIFWTWSFFGKCTEATHDFMQWSNKTGIHRVPVIDHSWELARCVMGYMTHEW